MIKGFKELENQAKKFGMVRLSRKLDISRSFLYSVFNGTGVPTLTTLERLAKALGYRVVIEPHPDRFRPRKNEILKLLHEHKSDLEAAGIKTLALFGSVARDEAKNGSDVDLVIEIHGSKNLRNMGKADKAIAAIVPFKTDIVYLSSLKPEILKKAQKDFIYVIGQKSRS